MASVVVFQVGCAPPADRVGFDSARPDAVIFAAQQAVNKEDRTAIPSLIESLDSDDPAVRFVAIHALSRLTGKTYDYRYYDPEYKRIEAVDRWEEAYSSGELDAGFQPNDMSDSSDTNRN